VYRVSRNDLSSPFEGGRPNRARQHEGGSHVHEYICTRTHAGADYYESDEQKAAVELAGGVPIGIGAGSTISNAIIDKNARIGKNVTIMNKAGVQDSTDAAAGIYIRSGIVVIQNSATVADGTVL
jgi:hypothetical protein